MGYWDEEHTYHQHYRHKLDYWLERKQDYRYHHEHEDDEHLHGGNVPLEENMLWRMDNIELKSVGIDIGSAGTQVIFSLLKLKRMGEDLSSRYVIVSRESIYQSPVQLTPYLDQEKIDDVTLGEMITNAYYLAGLTPEEIDTGAVILTGEAIRRHNARGIAEVLARQGGNFVCASAGHNMESLLAAYGSGAALFSHQRNCRILNIDIGGGTTKFAVVENGRVIDTATLYIGGRLLTVDENRRIVRLDPGGRNIAGNLGMSLQVGDVITAEQMKQMAAWMADAILSVVLQKPLSTEMEKLYLTSPLKPIEHVAGIMFSGGVGEYVYNREDRDFNDLGKLLGTYLRRQVDQAGFPWTWLPAGECIRATVMGASEHSVQVSGNTIYISDPALLPRKNLQVLRPPYDLGGRGSIDPDKLTKAIRDHFTLFDLVEGEADVAFAFHWDGEPSYERVSAFVRGLEQALQSTIGRAKPIVLVFDGDIAKTVGSLLVEEGQVTNGIISIDGINLQDFEFIDIGQLLKPSDTVPVTIKSLIFKL